MAGTDDWFMCEVLPLEPMLTRFLRRHWRDASEIVDLRQEVYARAYEAARREQPVQVKPFLFQIARNLIIDRLRQKSIVSIETIGDVAWLDVSEEAPSPESHVIARQELRILQAALDDLPPKCRQVILLRKVEGMSQKEVAKMMGSSVKTVENHVAKGMRLLANSLLQRRAVLKATVGRYRKLMG